MEQSSAEEMPVLVWHGSDPVVFGAILAALQESEIPTYEMATHTHLLEQIIMPFQGAGNAIVVPASRADEARMIVDVLLERSSREAL